MPKLLGTYEVEIHAEVEKAARQNWHQIVNIGAAEGYYAVGFAMKCPRARITAFETNLKAHGLIRDLAAMNSVEVEVCGTCGPGELARVLQAGGATLVVCDVEGAEMELLDPGLIKCLRSASLLVEVHEGLIPGIGAALSKSSYSLTIG